MINLFKMDVYRFFTNKFMYILLLVYMFFQVFGIFMIDYYEQPTESDVMLYSEMNESQFIQAVISQTPSWVLVYIMVFIVYFYMSEYNAGFYKNYLSMKNARMHSTFSKILIQGLFTLLMFTVMLISDLIGRQLIFENATIGDLSYFVKLLAGQFLLHWAFSIVILCITMFLRNIITSLVIGFVLVLNIIGMVAGALESLIGDGNLTSYMLVNTIVDIKDFHNLNDFIHVASVGTFYFFLFLFIAIRFKMKEDLR